MRLSEAAAAPYRLRSWSSLSGSRKQRRCSRSQGQARSMREARVAAMSDATRTNAQRAAAAERWALPNVEGPVAGHPRDGRARAADSGSGEEQAARGYAAGMARAQAEMQARVQELD